jgi:hypothetical protein
MHYKRNANDSDIDPANPDGGQGFSADSMTTCDPVVSPRRLDWMGRHAFTARCAIQPAVDPILGMGWGPRHDQSVVHHLATLESPTGLVYAYDLTWDECAVLAIDVPTTAVEAALGRALASDAHLILDVFAGLLADILAAPMLAVQCSDDMATGIDL